MGGEIAAGRVPGELAGVVHPRAGAAHGVGVDADGRGDLARLAPGVVPQVAQDGGARVADGVVDGRAVEKHPPSLACVDLVRLSQCPLSTGSGCGEMN